MPLDEIATAWFPYFRYAVAIGLIGLLVYTGHLDINTALGAIVGLMFPLAHSLGVDESCKSATK